MLILNPLILSMDYWVEIKISPKQILDCMNFFLDELRWVHIFLSFVLIPL